SQENCSKSVFAFAAGGVVTQTPRGGFIHALSGVHPTMYRRSSAAILGVCVLALMGCGDKPVEVSGIVTIDGTPVEGATVTYITEDGTKSYSGFTDASGKFDLTGSDSSKRGALRGDYKVTVIKAPKMAGPGGAVDPNDSEAMKMMA